MKTVTKRELNQQTARVLADVTVGASVVVTDRGIPKWRIEAIEGHPDPIERLRNEGRIQPAKQQPRAWTSGGSRRYTPEEIDSLLDEMRGDR